MKTNIELEKEKREIEEKISGLFLKIEKLEAEGDEGSKLSWTRDDEIEILRKDIIEKQARLGKIANEVGD